MARTWIGFAHLLASCIVVGGCAFPTVVQRVGVEYNTAVAGMANELTLLNILRASEDLPLHYTSVSRLSGSVTVKTGASVNAALKGDATTKTDTTATTASATPGTVTTVAKQVAEGGNVFTPTVSGEVNTGPTFDIAILDTQKFYNGILGAIPFSTVENYINQGYSDQLLMLLLIERIDFKSGEDKTKGELKFSWVNAASGPKAQAFARNIACYTLSGRNLSKPSVDLAPASRLRRSDSNTAVGVTLQELALLDGDTLELSRPLTVKPGEDEGIMVRRPKTEKRVAELTLKDECRESPGGAPKRSASPPAEPVYLGNGKATVLGADKASDKDEKIEPAIVFRSTESVIRFLGHYLQATRDPKNLGETVKLNDKALFSVVEGKKSDALVSAGVLGKTYSIPNDESRRQNMLVIAIVEELVNLHKESADRPVTVPVQVVSG